MGLHVTETGTVSCRAFYDLDFDLWQFHRYDEYFTATSAFTLHPAGTYTGPASIKEYVKFASDESPFVDSFRVLPGGLALLKRMTPEGTCLFMVMGHRRYELSAKYAGGEAVHVATLATVTYTPSVHKINDIALYYETPFMQFVFDSIRTRKSAEFVCDSLFSRCPLAGVNTWTHNGLPSYAACITSFEALPAFDDGPRLESSRSQGGGFDGNSSSCRLLHSFLASINTDHCAHLSFKPMTDSQGRIKCQHSNRMQPSDSFDDFDMANFDQFKEAMGYPIATGFNQVDRCIYDSMRLSVPRPYWRAWRDAQPDRIDRLGWKTWSKIPPLERIPKDEWAWVLTYAVWISVLILGLGSEYVVGTVITAHLSIESLEIFWKAAAFTFPLFVTIALVSHSYWGLFFLVFGLWKCGSPETIVFLLMARSRNYRWLFRLQCALNFLGTLLHHSATSLLVVSLTTGTEFLDRNVLSCTLPLVVQHWFVLMRYVDIRLYLLTELAIEFVWEWEVIWNITSYTCHSWNIVMIAATMLVAHWLYLTAATLKYLNPCCGGARKTAPTPSGASHPSPMARLASVRDNVVYAALEAAEANRKCGQEKEGALGSIRAGLSSFLAFQPADDTKLAHHWRNNLQGAEPAARSAAAAALARSATVTVENVEDNE